MGVYYSTTICAWTGRVLYSIAAGINISILLKEIKTRREIYSDKDAKSEHILKNKELDLWSLLTLIASIILSVLHIMRKIPLICAIAYTLTFSVMGIQKILFTYYQIARLKYCFSISQIHSDRYGYPNYMFYVLYFIGFLLAIAYLKVFSMGIDVYDIGGYGCNIQPFSVNAAQFTLFLVTFITFFLWDWIVLGLYVYKVYQLQNHKIHHEFKQNVNDRILFILRKIIFLTILYEILAVFDVIPHFIILLHPDIQFYNIFAFSLDSVSGSLLMLLMIERNNDKYIKFVQLISMSGCCHICITKNQPLPNLQVQSSSNSTPVCRNGSPTPDTGNGTPIMGNHGDNGDQNNIVDIDDIKSIDTKTEHPVEFENNQCETSEVTMTEINCARL